MISGNFDTLYLFGKQGAKIDVTLPSIFTTLDQTGHQEISIQHAVVFKIICGSASAMKEKLLSHGGSRQQYGTNFFHKSTDVTSVA